MDTTSTDSGEHVTEKATTAIVTPIEDYITGIKLVLVIVACTTAGFLMLLDTSIVATVGDAKIIRQPINLSLTFDRQSRELQMNFIQFLILAGMELPIS
jgi:hypothetical protein